MTITIDVPAELDQRLEDEARRNGITKDEFVRIVLEEKLNPEPGTALSALPPKPRVLAKHLPVKDRSREDEWIRQHRDEYAGQWVALDGDNLIANGDDLRQVAKQARKVGVPDALMVRVEPRDALPFAGF